MASSAQRWLIETAPATATWRLPAAQPAMQTRCADNDADRAGAEFIDDLAESIAALCLGLPEIGAVSNHVPAIPLVRETEMPDHLCREPLAPCCQCRRAGIELYTEEGELRSLEEIEIDFIRLAIQHYGGRISEVARRLQIGRSTVYRKMEDFGAIQIRD